MHYQPLQCSLTYTLAYIFDIHRHTIIGPSSLFDYPARTFPGIVLALKDIDDDPDQEKRWSEVERQVVMLTQALQEATEVLKDFTSW